MNHFYLTLPSDSSSKYFPENTAASFKTKLSDRIDLDGEYEVGLAQLIYPHSWYNFNNGDKSLFTKFKSRDKDGVPVPEVVRIFPSSQFADEESMVRVLTESIGLSNIMFAWEPWVRKIKLNISSNAGVFHMSKALATMLGFDKEGPYTESGKYYADRTFDMHANLRMMYIYSDIASYSLVGDTKVPLLRVIDSQGAYGQMVSTTFTHPHYVPLARSDLETIEINISNELGKPVPFEFGKSVVTLHFRRKNKLI
jgi:hypothetical protein